jgi:hypothetical protein
MDRSGHHETNSPRRPSPRPGIGTNPVALSGKGKLEGVVYAPNSTVLKMSSTSDFHYDSTLRGK